VSPLFKYEITGKDSERFLSRLTVRDISRLEPGRVAYCCWCDDRGKVIDDGTISRLDTDRFRLTSTSPAMYWLQFLAEGFDVSLVDSTAELAGLAIQGPSSRAILMEGGARGVGNLRFFGVCQTRIANIEVFVSRTGYTGDLGYEIWVPAGKAERLWDTIMEAGRSHGLVPAGLDALDITRIEAGFILQGIDYFSATRTVQESRQSTPFELDMDWMVSLDREPFVGQAALEEAMRKGPARRLVGLELDWEELEALYEREDLPVNLPPVACRAPIPVYQGNRQVGQATSHTWSPLLKKSVALATVAASRSEIGTELLIEHTPKYERRKVTATVVKRPFFDPRRKRKP
jgi:aminomethyltransferase